MSKYTRQEQIEMARKALLSVKDKILVKGRDDESILHNAKFITGQRDADLQSRKIAGWEYNFWFRDAEEKLYFGVYFQLNLHKLEDYYSINYKQLI